MPFRPDHAMAPERPPSRRAAVAAAARLLRSVSRPPEAADPLVRLWREWRSARSALRKAGGQARRLERTLADRVGPGAVRGVDDLLGRVPEADPRRREELAAALARWAGEARACGLTRARAEEEAVAHRMERLRRAAVRGSAASLAGVVARLAIAGDAASSGPDAGGLAWTVLTGTLADLTALAEGGA
ncbi:hypothetical protein [Azospirillum sp. B21]|uniref:hypothetical protein n=1 Tax=Azospirillum sp. B21 TaxID=2607496 RepID=UPI0011F08B31|nr:hypothetical protein [Azospirillum sp. B21]